MGLLTIRAQKGKGLRTRWTRLKRGMPRARLELLRHMSHGWRKVVKESTWLSPKPSPDGLVIAKISGRGYSTLKVGWIDYKGGAARALRRLELRRPIMDQVTKRIIARRYLLREKG